MFKLCDLEKFRMLWIYFWVCFVPPLPIGADHAEIQRLSYLDTPTSEPDLQQIRSPLLEVFMHLPPNFRDVESFKNMQGVAPERLKRATNSTDRKTLVDVRKYQVAQPALVRDIHKARIKRQEGDPQKALSEKPEPQKLLSPSKNHPMLPMPDAIRGSQYAALPVKEFDVVDIDDPDDPRRRRTDSSNDSEDNAQRDKRTFLEEASAETTTSVPFWKRKKENPPFVTGRGSAQIGNNYPPAQHRSSESSRESHSMKNIDKSVQSNEISRTNHDNFYSSTNRRTYSRQYDGSSFSSSTPKSVYDTIDYSAKRNADRSRNHDDRKDLLRQPTPPTHEHYTHRQQDRSPQQPPYPHPYPYPYPADVLGRGVEYYHRTFDPATGRIIYYANMPDNSRSPDLISRSLYLPGKPFGPFHPYQPFHPFDPYHRAYVPPLDYRFLNGYVNGYANNYVRSGRSGAQAYSYPFQERDKFQRDAKFVGGFDATSRFKDEPRNKTYIIYDADESRSQFSRPQTQYGADVSRLPYPPTPMDNLPRPQLGPPGQGPFKQFSFPPTADRFPPSGFSNRNNFYSSGPGPAAGWGFSHRTLSGITQSNANSRPLHSPEVQLPLTTAPRDFDSKSKKS